MGNKAGGLASQAPPTARGLHMFAVSVGPNEAGCQACKPVSPWEDNEAAAGCRQHQRIPRGCAISGNADDIYPAHVTVVRKTGSQIVWLCDHTVVFTATTK